MNMNTNMRNENSKERHLSLRTKRGLQTQNTALQIAPVSSAVQKKRFSSLLLLPVQKYR